MDLLQTHEDGARLLVGHWNRSLNIAERNYSTTEKECLALVCDFQILRLNLECQTFQVYNDHEPLKWLLGATYISGRLASCCLRLSKLRFSIENKKLTKNQKSDTLPRFLTIG